MGICASRETTNQRDRGDSVLRNFIVDSDEQRRDILCLSKMLVKTCVYGEKHRYEVCWCLEADQCMDYDTSCGTRARICNRYHQRLVHNVANDLNGVVADLVANRVPYEQTTTRRGYGAWNVGTVLARVR